MPTNYKAFQVRPILRANSSLIRTFGNIQDAANYRRELRQVGVGALIRYESDCGNASTEVISVE